MNKWIQTGKQRITLALAVALSGWVFVPVTMADGLASDYVSYPPLINTSASGDKPNILLMLDTSGSMNDNTAGNYAGSNHQDSRAIIAKKAVATIMDKYSVVANMGLMGFQPPPNFDYNRSCPNNRPQCEWVGQNVGGINDYKIRRGYLYIPMGSVNSLDTDADTVRRRNDFRRRLGLDVVRQTPDVFGRYPMFAFSASTYKSSTDYNPNRRIISDGGTPLEGTYMSALEYYQGTLSSSYKDPELSNYAATTWTTTGQCSAQNFAIMITDGMPSVKPNGQACSGDCGEATYTSYMAGVKTQAEALADAGVQSYVIGFAVGNEDYKKTLLNSLAEAGGATTTAFLANNLSELEVALDDIFGDIVERASSGTGAAVVANKGSGLAADFQALYTPKKTDSAQNVVNWIGTLQGFFLDEAGRFREDSNGNGLLDDYTVDRILEFNYSTAQDKTLVRRILSTKVAGPDDQTNQTSYDEVNVEDIKAIWKARDTLAAITDVLTQRPYGDDASTGRRIYTSFDGETLRDFVSVDAALLTQIDQTEADQWEIINDLDDKVDGTRGSIPNATANVAASVATLQTHVASTLSDAIAEVSALLPGVRGNAEAAVAAAQAALDAAIAQQGTAQADLDAANAALAAATATNTAAQTALSEATAAQAAAATAESTANAELVAATAAVTTAGNDRTAANNTLTDATAALATANTAQATAQSAFDTAQGDLGAAQTAFNTASDNVATATDARNTAATAAASALTDRDAAQAAFDQAEADRITAETANATADADYQTALTDYASASDAYDLALQALQQEQSTNPPCDDASCQAYADWQAAQATLATAEADRDAAQVIYDQSVLDLTNAQAAEEGASTTLAAAESALTTADSNVTTAQETLDAATVVRDGAQADLASARSIFDGAEAALNSANSDRDAAQAAFDNAQTAFNEADAAYNQAVADRDAAEVARDNAVVTREAADATLAAATTAAGTASGELTTATGNQAAAQQAYNDAAAAATQEQDDLTYANGLLADAEKAEGWVDEAERLRDALNDALADAANMPGMSDLDRKDLIDEIDDLIADISVLIGQLAYANGDSIFAALNAEVLDLLAALTTSYNLLINPDATENSLQEYLAQLNSLMTTKEAAQGALVKAYQDLDPLAHLRYMDDNITGQAGDVDLSYTERNEVIKWVRGEEISGMRNRTVAFSEGETPRVWRLPDIVHSTPAVVGRPSESYYSIYADDTYRYYIEQKFNRRQVVYVGSNGGMLHAFNAGFWDDSQNGYVTRLSSDTTSVQHPLGAELWAYVPKAVLPLLQFVADPEYKHMALVDGAPQTFDVNIFTPSTKHPGGWGTILVVNMRLGGGPFTVRIDDDRDGVVDDYVVRPSVMIFDVTDPESEPELIAELSHPQMGYTLGRPAVVKYRRSASEGSTFTNPSANEWLLVFGSGPTEMFGATSDQQARLFTYDLKERDWNSISTISLENNAFVGDVQAVDWNGDYVDDVLYFGLNSGTASAPDGQVSRLELVTDSTAAAWLASNSLSTLVDVNRTVLARPATQMDAEGRHWVSFGTGRSLVVGDNTSTQQQYLFGVMEPLDTDYLMTFASVSTSNLMDVTSVEVDSDGNIINAPSGEETLSELAAEIKESKSGWRVALEANGSDPSGRSVVRPTQQLRSLIYNEYRPSGDVCSPEGETEYHAVNIATGTVSSDLYFGTYVGSDGNTYLAKSLDMGRGQFGEGVIINGKFVSHSSLGTAVSEDVFFGVPSMRRQSWRQIFDFGF